MKEDSINFRRALREINSTLSSILLFNAVLNTMVVFLVSYLFLLLTGLPVLYAFFPSLIFLAIFFYLKSKESRVRKVESKYGHLNEKLRTAADNEYLSNPVVEELQKEVVKGVRDVEVSSFLNTKKLTSRIVSVVVLCFLILMIASSGVKPINFSFLGEKIKNVIVSYGNETGPVSEGGIKLVSAKPGAGEIYGNQSQVSLGRKEEELKISVTGYELTVRDIKEAEKQEFEEKFPDEIFVASASAYEENIPKEQQELVKNYFKKLAGG